MKQEFFSEIIEKIRRGDENAVSELVNKTMNLALHIAGNLLYNKTELEDTIQDIYIKVWHNLGKYDEEKGNFIPWFAKIARNQSIDRNRKIRINPDENLPLNEADKSPSADEAIHRSDFRNEILRLSEKLPKAQREIFILRDVQNLPINEVTKISGHSKGSIKTNLYLARKRIREMLDPEWSIK